MDIRTPPTARFTPINNGTRNPIAKQNKKHNKMAVITK